MPDAAVHDTDLIIGRSLITAETLAQDMRAKLAKELANRWDILPESELLELARRILIDLEPIVAEHMDAAQIAAWLAGFDSVAEDLPEWAKGAFIIGQPPRPPRIDLPGLFGAGADEPELHFSLIEEAANRLGSRNILTREQFDQASEASKRQAFTISGDLTEDSIEGVRDLLAENISRGTSLRGFTAELEERLEPIVLPPGRLETIYRTNVQTAFRDGYETLASDPIVSDVFPYQEYLAIQDGRVRKEHVRLETLGLNGTNVYRRDDPMWDMFTPPWDFNCRCGTNLLTVDAAAERGVVEAQLWAETGQPPVHPQWRVSDIPFRPDGSFVGPGRRVGVA